MKFINPQIESSYYLNEIGETLYDLVLELKPKKILEFGALGGYSTISMAMALDELGEGYIDSYDLWTKYPYKHTTIKDAESNAVIYEVDKYINFYYGSIWDWKPEKYDLCHIDISNDGENLAKAVEMLKDHVKVIVFEGGSKERDHVDWMVKYNKKKINGSLDYKVLNYKFPSLSQVK